MTPNPRLLAFDALLSQPDPPEMPLRAHHRTWSGKPWLQKTLAARVARVFLEQRKLGREPETLSAAGAAVQRFPRRA